MRTAANADMKFNQLFYGPYIGVGSPIDQTWWVDDLVIADGIPTVSSQQWAAGSGQSSLGSPQVAIYPNPNDGVFTVDVNENISRSGYSIEIINSLGRQVYIESIQSYPATIDINLSAGLYYVKIKSSNGIIFMKKFSLLH